MPSPGIEPRNSQQKWIFSFYNFQLDLSEKVKQNADATNQVKKPSFFQNPFVERSSKNSN